MSNHRPYREWIFEEGSLPADSGRELNRHLQTCSECRTLAEGWDAVRHCLETGEMKAPREGFTSRWKALAAERIRTPSPRQAWALLAASSLGSLVMAVALAVQTSAQGLSLAGVFSRDLTAAAGMFEEWMDTSDALGGFLSIVSRSIPPACYLLAVFFICLLGVLWLLMFVRANARGEKR